MSKLLFHGKMTKKSPCQNSHEWLQYQYKSAGQNVVKRYLCGNTDATLSFLSFLKRLSWTFWYTKMAIIITWINFHHQPCQMMNVSCCCKYCCCQKYQSQRAAIFFGGKSYQFAATTTSLGSDYFLCCVPFQKNSSVCEMRLEMLHILTKKFKNYQFVLPLPLGSLIFRFCVGHQ